MKKISQKQGFFRRTATFALVVMLCACSAIQIDVDVYKGPMANHVDVELRQYASLAIAAKPIIAALRNDLVRASVGSTVLPVGSACLKSAQESVDYVACSYPNEEAYFLNSLLSLYEDQYEGSTRCVSPAADPAKELKKNSSKAVMGVPQAKFKPPTVESSKGAQICPIESPGCELLQKKEDRARDCLGIEELSRQFNDALIAQAKTLGPNSSTPGDVNAAKKLNAAQARLNDALIIFAQRILVVVNKYGMPALASYRGNVEKNANEYEYGLPASDNYIENSSKKINEYAKKMAILQTIGNTIITFADDFSRIAEHGKNQTERSSGSHLAAQMAFEPGAPKAFDEIVREMKSRLAKDLSSQQNLNTANAALAKELKTREAIDAEKAALNKDVEALSPLVFAYRTFFDTWPAVGIPVSDNGEPADRKRVAALFPETGTTTMDDVVARLGKWLDETTATPAAAIAIPPAYARRAQARKFLSGVKSGLPKEEGTPKVVFGRVKAWMLESLESARKQIADKQTQIAHAEAILKKAEKTKSSLTAVDKRVTGMGQVESVLQQIKPTVLAAAQAGNTQNLAGVRNLILQNLQNQLKDPDGKDLASIKVAHDAIQKIPAVAVVPPRSPESKVNTAREVLDDVIVQLQYQRLQASAAGFIGTVKSLDLALDQATEQRAGHAYLRPASAYLRSAYSSNALQGGGYIHKNILLSTIFAPEKSYDIAFHEQKVQNDREFWQNINQVKLSGGGSTDFALVKDDVGNWYVKGFSADPQPIIKSAIGLALFNKGGNIDVNLLGQLQDRQRADDSSLSATEREAARARLTQRESSSGVNTTALAKVYDKYRGEYSGEADQIVKKLMTSLTGFSSAITADWATIPFGEFKPESTAALNGLVVTMPEIDSAITGLKAAEKARTDAKTPVPAASDGAKVRDAADKAATDGIINALRQTRDLRLRLVGEVNKLDALLAVQTTQLLAAKVEQGTQEKAVATAEAVVATDQKEVDDAKLVFATSKLPADEAKIAEKKKILEGHQKELEVAKKELKTRNEAVVAKETNLKNAKDNRSKAARKVTVMLDTLIAETASKKLDSVNTFKTAIGFVGETAGGR